MRSFKVSEVNEYIKKIVSLDIILSDISIEGEISNFTHHRSGHMYFDLKDKTSKIKCIMFKSYNSSLSIDLKEGLNVIARGNVSIYERDGVYQLYVTNVEEQGIGELYKEFERLKTKLESEGLFDNNRKKLLPSMPLNVGVVTSYDGAAIRDIINVISRRLPSTNVILYPSLVQGSTAFENVIEGLLYLDQDPKIDLIIFGRGGGSIEELSVFNDEALARVIAELETPTISAVGHETDFTISDFVADYRAPTPSAAAEIAVPSRRDLKLRLNSTLERIINIALKDIEDKKKSLSNIYRELKYLSPDQEVISKKQDLDILYKSINQQMDNFINKLKSRIEVLSSKTKLQDPTLGLDKGYGLLLGPKESLIKSVKETSLGENITILLKDGKISAKINYIDKEVPWK